MPNLYRNYLIDICKVQWTPLQTPSLCSVWKNLYDKHWFRSGFELSTVLQYFTSSSHGNIATEGSPKAKLCPLFEWLQGFFIVHINIDSTVHTCHWTVWSTVYAQHQLQTSDRLRFEPSTSEFRVHNRSVTSTDAGFWRLNTVPAPENETNCTTERNCRGPIEIGI